MEKRLSIAFVLPHPDDEALALGLPAELANRGHDVHLIALTKGDLGSHTISSRRRIARIRKREFQKAGEILGATTAILPFHDGDLPFVEKKAGRRLLRELRERKTDVILTTSGNDYHDDHIAAYRIARWAAFHLSDAPIKTRRGIFRRNIAPIEQPVSFYSMDTQGSQQWQNTEADNGIRQGNLHPVNTILQISEEALYQSILAFKQHKSQLTPRSDGQTDYVTLAKLGAQRRGQQAGFRHAAAITFESFGGYAFSARNILAEVFGKRRTKLLT